MLAQSPALGGRVVDAQGGGVVNALVTLSTIGTAATRTTRTLGDGTFMLGGVADGTYQLQVESLGFERWTQSITVGGWRTIPASGSKDKLAHRVPLNASALAILRSLKPTYRDDVSDYVLGAKARRAGAGARGKRQQSEAAQTFTVENFRGHDLRRNILGRSSRIL